MKLVAFCEAASDHRVLACLIDRVLRERGPRWVADLLESSPDALRTWLRDPAGRDFFDLHRFRQYALERGVRLVYGHFDGQPGSAGALMGRTVFRVVRSLVESTPEIAAVVLVWDMDDEPADRRSGLEQARAEAERIEDFAIVLGCPNAMREAWLLTGFEPDGDDESRRLDELAAELGFAPNRTAHELTAADETAKRSAKRVLRILSGGSHDREARCWAETPLETLRARSAETGLREFLDEIEERLVPRLLKP